MTLALDGNHKPLMTREDLCIGEFRTLANGADEKPVSAGSARRLMPYGNEGAVVAGKENQFRTGAIRDTILSVKGWVLEILHAGYQQKHLIKEFGNGVATLDKPLNHYEGLESLGANVQWVVFPTLNFPLSVHHIRGNDQNDLVIGVTNENVYAPTKIVKYAEVMRDTIIILPTQQVQNVFYWYTGTRTNADGATIQMSWGEHYIVDARR